MSVYEFSKDNNVYFEFYPNHCLCQNPGYQGDNFSGKVFCDDLYVFPSLQQPLKSSNNTTTCSPMLSLFQLWHSKLGHALSNIVHSVMRLCNIYFHKQNSLSNVCCIHQLPFSDSTTFYFTLLVLVHIDIWGPLSINASNGSKYYIAFFDAFSRFTWLYLINAKSQALSLFIRFKTYIEKQIGCVKMHPNRSCKGIYIFHSIFLC